MSREASPHDDVVDSETVPLLNILSLQGNVDCNLLMHIACMYQVQRVLAAARARKEKVLALGLPATPTGARTGQDPHIEQTKPASHPFASKEPQHPNPWPEAYQGGWGRKRA